MEQVGGRMAVHQSDQSRASAASERMHFLWPKDTNRAAFADPEISDHHQNMLT
jgi:hypothetical protein